MAFVKLDCKMLDSTIWLDREARELFITALLMARPFILAADTPQIEADSLNQTGFMIPAGEYGIVQAAGPGIINRAGIGSEIGMLALKRLGSPEATTSTTRFEGRRLVRIDGGYIVLNYMVYRDKDHTAAIRSKRYRQKHKRKRKDGMDGKPASAAYKAAESAAVEKWENGDETALD